MQDDLKLCTVYGDGAQRAGKNIVRSRFLSQKAAKLKCGGTRGSSGCQHKCRPMSCAHAIAMSRTASKASREYTQLT